MINELDSVVLTADVPELGLASGDIGTVVMVHDQGAAYEVEFIALDGETIGVTTLTSNQIRSVREGEIAHARQVVA